MDTSVMKKKKTNLQWRNIVCYPISQILMEQKYQQEKQNPTIIDSLHLSLKIVKIWGNWFFEKFVPRFLLSDVRDDVTMYEPDNMWKLVLKVGCC